MYLAVRNPSPVVRALLQHKKLDGMGTLQSAAEGWPVPEQVALWRRVAGVGKDYRELAWRRLAELEQ